MIDDRTKIMLTIVAVIIFASMGLKGPEQSIGRVDCYETKDCEVAVNVGYCNATYECISGKCWSEQIRCPELCYNRKDDDMDDTIDCKDPDCFDSIYCPCTTADFNFCREGRCYCPFGSPFWEVYEGGHGCGCG